VSTPSFAQLFRRSRYSKSSPDAPSGDTEAKQNRLEVFSVAAVGFALRFDAIFKKHFIKTIAGNTAGIEIGSIDFEPRLQEANCSDLQLDNTSEHILINVEFKVGAKLESHQNPWYESREPNDDSRPFWTAGGYGHLLGNKENYKDFSRIFYVVIEQGADERTEAPINKFGKMFFLRKRSWKSIFVSGSQLETNLVSSLGELGIKELEEWHMKEITIDQETIKACCQGWPAMEVLKGIASRLVKSKRDENCFKEFKYDKGDLPNIGFALDASVAPKLSGGRSACLGQHLLKYGTGWCGYVSKTSGPFRAEVWFYCNQGAKDKLRNLIANELKTSVIIQDCPDDTENGLRVIRPDESTSGHFDGFVKF
jgi:hypothetical protein